MHFEACRRKHRKRNVSISDETRELGSVEAESYETDPGSTSSVQWWLSGAKRALSFAWKSGRLEVGLPLRG